MGKLHKIRKAVEANPKAFMGPGVWKPDARHAKIGANGNVYPSGSGGHRKYVLSVLRGLGYNVE